MLGVELTEDEFERFRGLIYRTAGIRIPVTKRVMMTNRLRRRLRETGIGSFSDYYSHLTSTAGSREMPLFLDAITTNETYFYRDPQHFQWLAETFVPEIVREARLGKRERSLRIWSAAASTGEELYSIALKLRAQKGALSGWRITLLGTDISGAVLDAARAGSYDERALRLVPPDERSACFDHDPAAGRWTLKPEVRAMATWKLHNLLHPLREEPFDAVFLKNVMIYFDPESKKTAVRHLVHALAKGGYLVVGPTEGVYDLLGSLVRHKPWLYQKPA